MKSEVNEVIDLTKKFEMIEIRGNSMMLKTLQFT